MDSASPIASRTAGQPTVTTGTATFATGIKFLAEKAFAFDWLAIGTRNDRTPDHARHRDAHHRPATGEAAPV